MAKVFISLYNFCKIPDDYTAMPPFFEAFIEGMKDAGNDVLVFQTKEIRNRGFETQPASSAARAQRRLLELQGKGVKANFEDVFRDIEYRDQQDSTRAAAPLKAAEDAVILDTTNLNLEESYRLLCRTIEEKLGVQPVG